MFESKGWLRTIGSTISAIGGIVLLIPDPRISIWGGLLMGIGAAIGGTGVVRAVAQGTLTDMSANRE